MAQTHKCFACDEETNVEEAANTCSFCHKTFHGQCSLSTAAASAHLSIGFICTFGCLQAFEAGRHYRQRTEHKCRQCDKTYSTASNLEAHVKSEHEQVTHGPCPCCTPFRYFTTKQSLLRHVMTKRKAVAEAIRQLNDNS